MEKKTKILFTENNRLLKSYYTKEMKNKKNYKIKIRVRSISKKNIEKINSILQN